MNTAIAMPESMRLFYALWPNDATRAALQALQMYVSGRKTDYANLHLTLAFLGEQPSASLPALKATLTRLPRAPIALTIDRLAYFNKSRIAWAGSHAVPATLMQLQEALAQGLRDHGVAFDQRGFRPHVTLARAADAPQDRAFNPFDWRADEVALVRSMQTDGRLVYQVLATQRLDDGAPAAADAPPSY